jgi:hypothetical protein
MTIGKPLGLLTLLLSTLPVIGQPKSMDQKISVRLSFSVEEYEPTRPSKAVMKCELLNDSPVGIHVPVGFDNGYVCLKSGGLTLTKLKREKEDVKLVWVEREQKQVIFELPLDDLLVSDEIKKGAKWYWRWQQRSAPPFSPIYKGRKEGFVNEASFIVVLDLGSSTIKSDEAKLKIK